VKDSRQRLSAPTVVLHWSIAVTVVGLWSLGHYMASTRSYGLWPLHISTGTVLFVFVIVRVVWRIANGWPKPVAVYARGEQVLARIVHWTLLLSLLLLPISGLVSSYAGGYDLTVFGWQLIPDNPNHAIVAADAIHKLRVTPRNEALHDGLQVVHRMVGWVLAAAFVLHVAGALKHQLIYKDGTLRRMLGARVD
jgi:cytochrome b561